ncbi:MAG TPA: hypothetical protein IAB38_01855 [Candidatus Onthousia excrementipullorum]|uniref:Uncharacterized protein n=1 Tax=Candidatus Onthousia excrementipullorum TaxID=2840884 RepID=A0A9D1DTT4_9FIRM|nr:hypothetical protein [Candidatus Onthousia excrementipullorum]
MENVIDFLATKEVLIVLAIIGLILFVYFILWFHEFMKKHEEKKKLQNNTMQLNKLVEEVAKARKEEASNVTPITKEEPKKEEVKEEKVEVPLVNNTTVVTPTVVPEVKEEKVEIKEPTPDVVIENVASSPIEVEPVVVSVKENPVNTNDSIMLNDKFEEKVEVVEPTVITPVESPKNEQEVIKYKDEVYTESEAKAELERITEELKKLENEDKEENIELTKFETEQEENAIISLDELIAKGKTITEQNEVTQYQDDGNEPISIQELEERYRKEKEQVEVLEVEEEPKTEKPKLSIDDFLSAKEKVPSINEAYTEKKSTYHPSPIISPIYGIEEEPVKKNTTLELENTANYEKFDEEIRKTNEFLSKLKELQQKLD